MATPYPEGGPPSGAPGGKTSLGLDSNLGAMLCYIANIVCCLGIILSVVFLITEKENRFVKFHALQSLFLFVVYAALAILVQIIGVLLRIAVGLILAGLITWGLWALVTLIVVILWIWAGIKAYGGQWYKLPGIGDLTWNIVNKNTSTNQ
jgi:Predicted membrane protein